MTQPGTETPADNGNPKYLVLLATTTREKIDEYNVAARAKGVPVEFRPLTDVERYFHTAAEDTGEREKNAEQKLGEIEKNIAACREPGSPSRASLERKCKEWGIAFDPSRIYFATDDSTFTVAGDIWKHFKEKLKPLVEDNLLESKAAKELAGKNGNLHDVEIGPGAEFGPIAAAVGMTNYFNLLREAAIEAGYGKSKAPVGVTQQITMLLHPLDGSPTAPPIKLEARREVFLHTPKGLETPFGEPADAIAKTEHFLRSANKDVAQSTYWSEYVKNDHERTDIIDALSRDVFKYEGKRVQPRRPVAPKQSFAVGLPTARHPDATIKDLMEAGVNLEFANDLYHGDPMPGQISSREHKALSQESIISRSDALLFTPFAASDGLETRTANYLALISAKVAKLLIARDMNKPIVIMNHKGCWQGMIDTGMDLVNKGMFKDHLMVDYESSPVPKTPGVEHLATRFYDVVSGDDLEQLRKAAVKVLEHRRKEYIPFNRATAHLQDPFLSGGPAPLPPDDMFKVAVFVSAQNDNRRLLTDMRDLGFDLARQEFGLIWGGGDRHGMGAVYDGYRKFKEANPLGKTWMAAFSTEPILKSETEHGRIPSGVDYWEQNVDIYQRMANMIHKSNAVQSNAIVVAPGGDGTLQEWLSVLQLKHQFPDMMKNKSLILYTPDLHRPEDSKQHERPFWEQGIKVVMGNNFYENIVKDHSAYGKSQGIYLATDKGELMKLLKHLRGEDKDFHVSQLEKPVQGPQLYM